MQGTTKELAADLGIPAEEIDQLAAGINHMAFFLRFEHEGTDLYPALREVSSRRTGTASATRSCGTSATS